ncbi:hypothetical protein VQ056_23190 [Paenibacillus sp. JTLBN-2024]
MKTLVLKMNVKQKVQKIVVEIGCDMFVIALGMVIAHLIKAMA